eukprot:Phypoly_transcript_00607.p1 GENE.Phypoly_transcript_00607~~Phypoly_transcript_00607.p1  ORF type:complete len:1416 (+),score=260.93 Phypoly_transcript_00607:45-4250(+)
MAHSFPSIFTECQRSIATHKKCVAAAIKLLLANHKALDEFLACVDSILVVDKRHPAVERCVSFIGNLVTSYSSDTTTENRKSLWSPLLAHLLERSNAKDASVRFRACQIIAETMSLLPEDIEIDDELWDDLCEKMVIRTKDKAAITRSYAVRALARLQDPSDSHNPVIVEYVRLLATDPTKEVRKAVLTNMGISKKTLPYILQRSHDLCDEIRKETYQLIGRKVDVRALTIAQRQQLLEAGLQDRSDEVRKAVVCMAAGWLSADKENGIGGIEWLLRCLDVENDGESVARMVIQELYKAELLQLPAVNLSELSPEIALLWRGMCELWRDNKDPQLEALPELSQLCRVIVQHQSSSSKFVVRQLIQLTKYVDLADEVGRRNLNALICQMLCNVHTPLEFISPLLELLSSFHNPKDFASLALEIISELRYPLYTHEGSASRKTHPKSQNSEESESDATSSDEEDVHESYAKKSDDEEHRSAVQVRLVELNKQLAALDRHSKKKGAEAKCGDEDLRTLLEKEKVQLEATETRLTKQISVRDENECKCWCQSLDIALFLLQHTDKMNTHAGVMEMHAVMLSKALHHPLAVIRARGVCCTVLYCLLDYDAARSHIPIFLQLLCDDLPAIQLSVIKGIFDLIAFFGPPMLQDSVSYKGEKLLALLSAFLLHDDEDFRYAAVEGFAKLFMADIATAPQQFTHLVLLFFNPVTAEDLELRQCLSVFFSAFVCRNFDAHSRLIEAAFTPTLKTIINAPHSSPIKKIQLLHVAQFLLTLLDNSNSPTPNDSAAYNHAWVAAELAHEILANPKDNKELCKVLPYCSVSEDDQDLLKSIEFLVEEIAGQKTIQQDKLIAKGLAKFAATIKHADRNPGASLTPSKVGKIWDKIKSISDAIEKAESDEELKPKRKQTRKPLPKKTPRKKPIYQSDSESSVSESEEEEEEEVLVRKAPTRAPSTRRANLAAKNRMKELSSDEPSESSYTSESGESDASDASDAPSSPACNIREESDVQSTGDDHKEETRKTAQHDNNSTDSETDTESEQESEQEVPTTSQPVVPKGTAQPSKDNQRQSDSEDENQSERESGSDNESYSESESNNATNRPNMSESEHEGSSPKQTDTNPRFPVRQVSLYSSDDESDDYQYDSEDDLIQANKENLPDNTPLLSELSKTPFVLQKSHLPPQAHPEMDTSKKIRCLELHEEIGNLLDDDDDSKHTRMHQTALAMDKLLEEISSTSVSSLFNPNNPAALPKSGPSKPTVRVSPKGVFGKPVVATKASTTASSKAQIPLQKQPQKSLPSKTASNKLPVTSKSPTNPLSTSSVKSPPLPLSSRLSIQPTSKGPCASISPTLSSSSLPSSKALPTSTSRPPPTSSNTLPIYKSLPTSSKPQPKPTTVKPRAPLGSLTNKPKTAN